MASTKDSTRQPLRRQGPPRDPTPVFGGGALRKAVKRTGRPVVLIQWVDCAGPDGWTERGDWTPKGVQIETVGWLVSETECSYAVTSSIFDAQGGSERDHAPMAIPKRAVLKFQMLRKP